MAVSLGTYTGWNLRPAAMGASGQLAGGTASPFVDGMTSAPLGHSGPSPNPSL